MMTARSNCQAGPASSSSNTVVDTDTADSDLETPSLHPVASSHGHTSTAQHQNGNGPLRDIILPEQEEERNPSAEEKESWSGAEDWEEQDDTATDDEFLVLEEDPAEMSSWAGQPSVKGSSEVMRMMLLTFSSVGITSVLRPIYRMGYGADGYPAALHGALR
jgi:hypothetical protein